MEKLTETPFFRMLLQQNGVSALTEADLSFTYKAFVCLLAEICMTTRKDIPAFFTLNYTHVELIGLQEENEIGAEKKCAG